MQGTPIASPERTSKSRARPVPASIVSSTARELAAAQPRRSRASLSRPRSTARAARSSQAEARHDPGARRARSRTSVAGSPASPSYRVPTAHLVTSGKYPGTSKNTMCGIIPDAHSARPRCSSSASARGMSNVARPIETKGGAPAPLMRVQQRGSLDQGAGVVGPKYLAGSIGDLVVRWAINFLLTPSSQRTGRETARSGGMPPRARGA